MSDLISRADAIRLLVDKYKFTTSEATEILSELPSAERNCFTCGIENGEPLFFPEKVDDEVLDADTRLVRLSDVCKLIQENYEVSPYVWGKLQSLPSIETIMRDATAEERASVQRYIDSISTEVVQGEWTKTVDGNGWNDWWIFKCPICGATIEDKQSRSWEYNFCPNCGARMNREDGEA